MKNHQSFTKHHRETNYDAKFQNVVLNYGTVFQKFHIRHGNHL